MSIALSWLLLTPEVGVNRHGLTLYIVSFPDRIFRGSIPKAKSVAKAIGN